MKFLQCPRGTENMNLKVLFIITSKYQKRFELSSSHTIFSLMLKFLGFHCSDDQRLVSNSYACINESTHTTENPFVFFSWQWPELKPHKQKKKFFLGQIDLGNGYIIPPSKGFIRHLCIIKKWISIFTVHLSCLCIA